MSNIQFFSGEGYEATDSEILNRNEQNSVMEENTANEQINRICSTEEETNTHNSNVENDVDEEIQSNNCINSEEMQSTNDNISSNTTSQSLVNGLSCDAGVEDMNVVSDDVNQENPSSR